MDTRARRRSRGVPIREVQMGDREPEHRLDEAVVELALLSPRSRGRAKTKKQVEQNAADIPDCLPSSCTLGQSCSSRTSQDSSHPCSSHSSTARISNSCSRISAPAHRRSASPARVFRQREQSELQHLNGRLITYTDHVKQLQAENARLRLQVETMDDVIKTETSNIKQLHQMEVKGLRDLLDKNNEGASKLASENEQLLIETNTLASALQERDKEVASLQERLQNFDVMSVAFDKLKMEHGRTSTVLQESQDDVTRLKEELVKEKRSKLRLEEEAKCNKDRYLREVEEASTRFSQHIQDADQKLEEGYESMVADALENLREQHVRDLEGLRTELTDVYQTKLTEWKAKCEVAEADVLALKREVKVIKQSQDQLKDNVTQVKAEKASLEVKLSDTQARLGELKDTSERDRCQAQREVAWLEQELSEVKQELLEMGGVNTKMEAEINAYRLIVEGLEEQTPTKPKRLASRPGTPGPQINMSGKKRRKTRQAVTELGTWQAEQKRGYIRTNEFSQGIHIADVDVDGKYVTLVNTTDHVTDLCLWTVHQWDGAERHVKYEIKTSMQLAKGKRLMIWSSDVGQSNNNDNDSNFVGIRLGDNDDDDGREMRGGYHVTMTNQSWLKLLGNMTIRVEDGDGQLQVKCDINAIQEESCPDAKKPRLFPSISSILGSTRSATTQADGKARKSASASRLAEVKIEDSHLVYGSSSFTLCNDAAMEDDPAEMPRSKDGCIIT